MSDGKIWSWLAATKARIKGRLGPLWWYSAVMFTVQRLGDLVNIYIGLWLVPHFVPSSQLGALLPLGQIGGLLGLPLAILLTPFGKFLNVFASRGEIGKIKSLLQDMLLMVLFSGVGVAIYTYWVSPIVFERMRVDGGKLVWILCGLAILGAVTPVLSNALQSLQRYRFLASSGLVLPPIRLGLLWWLLPALGVLGFFGVQLLIAVLAVAIAAWGLRHVLSARVARESYRTHLPEIARFTVPLLAFTVMGTFQSTCETFVIRHFLPDQDSAAFYILSRFAEIPCSIWGAVAIAFFPMVSERHERGEDSLGMLRQSLVIILLAGGFACLVLTWCADWLLGLTAAWAVYKPYGWLMGPLLLRILFLQAVACFTTYETACRRFGFLKYLVFIQISEMVLLYGLTGWGFFRPYLPQRWWEAVNQIHAARIDFIIWVMLAAAALGFIGGGVYLAAQRLRRRTAAAVSCGGMS